MSDEKEIIDIKPESALTVPVNQTLQRRVPVEAVIEDMQAVRELITKVMVEGEDFGTIPGTNKPTLYQPGAQKLGLLFRLAPKYTVRIVAEVNTNHRDYQVQCDLHHAPTDRWAGQGVGSCSTMEKKYRWRTAQARCPKCEKLDSVIKGKAEYGGGWLCWNKKGGCGAKFKDDDETITSQFKTVENADIADVYNTCLKMAKKRAYNDAMLTATAAGFLFTQDMEDQVEQPEKEQTKPPEKKPEKKNAKAERLTGHDVMTIIESFISYGVTMDMLEAKQGFTADWTSTDRTALQKIWLELKNGADPKDIFPSALPAKLTAESAMEAEVVSSHDNVTPFNRKESAALDKAAEEKLFG